MLEFSPRSQMDIQDASVFNMELKGSPLFIQRKCHSLLLTGWPSAMY